MIRSLLFVVLLSILLIVCPWLLSMGAFKESGYLINATLVVFGYNFNWSMRRLALIPESVVWMSFVIMMVLGIYGGLYDFFTAFLYCVASSGLLIITSGDIKFGHPVRLIALLLTVLFGALMLAFHFMYSI